MIATEVLPMLEEEARKRQAHGMTAPGRTLTELIPKAFKGEARNIAGEMLGVTGRYITEAKKINKEPI